jgi:hypothetical protein
MSMVVFSLVLASSMIAIHHSNVQKAKAALKPKRIRVMSAEEEARHRNTHR